MADLLSHREWKLEFLRNRRKIGDLVHHGTVRPPAHELPEPCQILGTSLSGDLNGSVALIRDPPMQSQTARRNPHEPPEPDALHPARNAKMRNRHSVSA